MRIGFHAKAQRKATQGRLRHDAFYDYLKLLARSVPEEAATGKNNSRILILLN
jgi:hypothetical protein